MIKINKPTYYLWINDFPTLKDYENEKEILKELGFRVVTFQNGKDEITKVIKLLITNYLSKNNS